MAFKVIPFNIVGGSHENRSRPVSVQRTVNMYLQVNEYSNKQTSLQSFPGQRLFSEVEGENERGMHVMNEVLYRIVDDVFYQVNNFGIHIPKGILPNSDRCIMENDGDNLVIVTGGDVYVYTESTSTFTQNANVNLKNVLSVTIINNQFIYTTEDLSFMSQPGDPFDVSGLNAIGAESSPDKLVRDYAFNQLIYRMGVRTGEPWYNSGSGEPPIDRIDGQQFSIGLGAIHSVANTDNAMYWLSDDKSIFRIAGGVPEKVSDDCISDQIEKMTRFDDAIGYAFTLQGQDFYLITFPSEDVTFCINEKLGSAGWFNLSSTNENKAYSATSSAEIYGKIFVASGGRLLTLETNEYTQYSDCTLRQRTSGILEAKDLNLAADSMVMSRLYLDVEQGVGLITGQGEVPRVMVEVSIDGGRSYPHVAWMELGRQGEHTLRTEVDLMARGQSFIFRLNISDPVPLTIKGAWLKVKGAGR